MPKYGVSVRVIDRAKESTGIEFIQHEIYEEIYADDANQAAKIVLVRAVMQTENVASQCDIGTNWQANDLAWEVYTLKQIG